MDQHRSEHLPVSKDKGCHRYGPRDQCVMTKALFFADLRRDIDSQGMT